MDLVLSQILHGLVYSMLLFLLAAGLSLIFGLMNVVNLAHGSFYMLGAFGGLLIYRKLGSFWLALLISPVVVGLIGAVFERALLRWLYARGHLDQVLLTFGLTFVLSDVVRLSFGTDAFSLPAPALLADNIALLAGTFPLYRVFVIAFGLGLALFLWIAIERTQIGAMVRAAVDHADMARGLGIDVGRLFTGVFSFGVGLAALGGVAAGPIIGAYFGMDSEIIIPAFIVVVIGGMGTLRGAFFGSLLVGEIETFGKAFIPNASLFLTYALMIAVLLVRPAGLFGVSSRQ
jgi:branched-subunit amino acid ABC-type transport system permease component